MATTSNGRAERKSLAGQLDRLDTILDGLADGLNEAVATAEKQAVTAAVEAALVEVLTSAELQRRPKAVMPRRAPATSTTLHCRTAEATWLAF